jgi:hypothetical protein
MHYDDDTLLSWVFSNHKKLGFSFKREKTESHINKVFITVSLQPVGMPQVMGFSIAENLEKALTKAITEALERLLFKFYSLAPSSNGHAAHTNPLIAKKNAIYELLERDIFLCHAFTEVESKLIMQESMENSHRISYYLLETFANVISILCVIEGGRDFGVIIGLGTGEADAIEQIKLKAYSEAFANYFGTFIKREPKPLDIQSFAKLPHIGIIEHLRLGLDHEYAQVFLNRFKGTQGKRPLKMPFDIDKDIKLIKLECEGTSLEGCPLHVYLAKSERLQNIHFGMPEAIHINLPRLESFSGEKIELHDLTKFIHPLP